MLKKIIYILGMISLVIITILNIVYTATLDDSEHIKISNNGFLYIVGLIILEIAIFTICKIINSKLNKENNVKKKKIFMGITITIYIIFNILWCVFINPPIVGDQIHACNLAQTFYSGNDEEFLPNVTYAGIPLIEYMQAYHQQISLAFVFSVFFRIIHFDGIGILRVLNIIGNIGIIIVLIKTCNQLKKKYNINKTTLLVLTTTFFPLIMLTTFIYGDIPSIALCLFSVYFAMRYTETNKYRYIIGASFLTMIAFMMRMNSLIFIIATTMYLVFSLINAFKNSSKKENIIKVILILLYITVSIIPSNLVKSYYIDKYNLDREKAYPNISYFLMAMEESPRANGWYSESIGEPALRNPRDKEIEYADRIKDRINYFANHLNYAFDFYTKKLASMWTENTYSAIFNNNIENIPLEKIEGTLLFYEKTILIFTSVSCIFILLQLRKNITLELLFLVTIFIGGFTFHILWEAKSRYIIPYIIVLIPIASIIIDTTTIKKIFLGIYNKIIKNNT